MKKINIDKNDIDYLTTQIRDIILQKGEEGISKDITIDISDFIKVDDNMSKTKVMFTSIAYAKMLNYIRNSELELAWHGVVERADGGFIIKDVFCYPQKVTGVTVQTDDEPYNQWINSLDADTYNNMRIQCHSHVNMSVTPSGTDWDYYKQQLRDTADDDFYIFLIMNKRHEIWCNVYDKLNNIHYESADIVFQVIDDAGADIITQCCEDISKYCQKQEYKSTTDKTTTYEPNNYYYNQKYKKDDTTYYSTLWEDDEPDYNKYLENYDEYRKIYIDGHKEPFISYREFRNQKLKENKNESK